MSFALLVTGLLLLNFAVLSSAIPETSRADGGCCSPNSLLAKDFSAYYTAAWALFRSPSEVYARGLAIPGVASASPPSEQFKYIPSFQFMVTPLLALPYGEALLAFDCLQFLLLPAMAAMIYYLAREKGLLATSLVAVAVLALPLAVPLPQWTVSASYYWQWAEGQSKVLETFLLLAAFALARSGRTRGAGVVFGIASFDPWFLLLGLPLLALYAEDFRRAFAWALGTLVLTNAALLYPPTMEGFLSMAVSTGATTPPYYYTLIPLAAIASLMALERPWGRLWKRGPSPP